MVYQATYSVNFPNFHHADPELRENTNIPPDQGHGRHLLTRSVVCGRKDLDPKNEIAIEIIEGDAGPDRVRGCGHVIGNENVVGHVNGSWDAIMIEYLTGATGQGRKNCDIFQELYKIKQNDHSEISG